jgi:uncharacterized protein YidB (DUF937 family)
MCVSCGCGQANNDQGNKRNITENDLIKAAQAAGISPQQAAENIAKSQPKTVNQASGSGTVASNHSQGPGFGPGPSDSTGTSPQVAG